MTAGVALALPVMNACSTDDPCALPDGATDGAVAVTFDPEAVAQDQTTFTLGIQAGGMTSVSALLWSFAVDDTGKRLRVWRPGTELGQVLMVIDADVDPSEGFFKHEIQGLLPGTWYDYAFLIMDGASAMGRSAIGRFRTAPSDDCLEPVRVAATACTNQTYAPFTALSTMAAEKPDLFLQLGDMSYNDGSVTRADFRERWAETLRDPGYRDILSSTGMYATLDDHELTDSGELYSLPADVRRAGIEAFFEHLPIERFEDDRFWTSYRWGRTCEFFVLDSRLERQPMTIGTTDLYLSRKQMDWFKSAIGASTAHFKVVLNSVPMTNMPPPWVLEVDRWEGYQSQREEILDHITDNSIDNVYFLSGDFHVSLVGRLEPTGPRSNIYEILCGPGGNGGNPVWIAAGGLPSEQEIFAPRTQFEFLYGLPVSTTLLFDPVRDVVEVRYVDAATNDVVFEGTLAPRKLRPKAK